MNSPREQYLLQLPGTGPPMSSGLLPKQNPAALQRIAIYAALIAAFAMIIGVSFGLGHG